MSHCKSVAKPGSPRRWLFHRLSFIFVRKRPEPIYSKKVAVKAYLECPLIRPFIHSFIHSYLGQTSNLFDTDVESEQVQGLLAHGRQAGDRGASLLHKGKVAVDPQLSLRLIPQLIHLCDLFPSGRGGAGLLEPRGAFGEGARWAEGKGRR